MHSENYRIIYILNKIADMVIVSILWCFCCLPVVTAGASTAALYYAVVKAVKEDQAYAASSFWSAFKGNLKQCLRFSVCAFGCLMMFGCTVYSVYPYAGNLFANVYLVFSSACFCIVIIAQIHASFLVGRFQVSGKGFCSVLMKLMMEGLKDNFVLFLTLLFAAELVMYYPAAILIVPAAFIYLVSFTEEKRFEKYIVVKK